MWVKICGNTRVEDCLAAAELGADAVGFVFVPGGKRTVTAAQVAAITRELPDTVARIGVFAGQSFEEIVAAVEEGGLTGVQLHGGVDDTLPQRLRAHFERTIQITQVMHWHVDVPAEEQSGGFAAELRRVEEIRAADTVLLDSKTRDASGGTGHPFEWGAVAPLLQTVALPVVVAGGLTPENVAEAVRVLRPAGVDVSSGVEAGVPGVKDRVMMEQFLREARSA